MGGRILPASGARQIEIWRIISLTAAGSARGTVPGFPSIGARAPSLVITAKLRPEVQPVLSVSSLVMRAKMHGFHFWLDDGILIPSDEKSEGQNFQLLKTG